MAGGKVESIHATNATQPASVPQAQCDPDLAVRGPWQELALSRQVGIALLIKPLPALDELGAEIAKVCYWPAEGGQPQFPEGPKDFQASATSRCLYGKAGIRGNIE